MLSRFPKSISAALAAVLLLSALLGCKSLPPSKPEAQFTAEEARGAQVYHVYCARCHYPTSTRGLNGPGLQAMTKVKSLPSGSPPTDERIVQTILHGRGMMPAQPIDETDLQSLLAYLHTL
jgi:mono/diheme cytochrome c family protein